MLNITSFTSLATKIKIQEAVEVAVAKANTRGYMGMAYVYNRKGKVYLNVTARVGAPVRFDSVKGNVTDMVNAGIKRGIVERRRSQLKAAMMNVQGDYFKVKFTKVDGSVRELTGFIDSDTGKAKPTTAKLPQYQVVYDVFANGYRTVNLDKVTSLIIDSKEVA